MMNYPTPVFAQMAWRQTFLQWIGLFQTTSSMTTSHLDVVVQRRSLSHVGSVAGVLRRRRHHPAKPSRRR